MRSFVLGCVVSIAWIGNAPAETSWLGFRGDGTNATAQAGPESIANDGEPRLAWKVDMPGQSVAGVVVLGDLVISSSSGGQDGERLFVTAVDLETGERRWQQSFRATGRPYCHPTSANASPTPVSDGKRIVILYSSNDLICLDRDGQLLWYRGLAFDYPKLGNDIGLASSPVIADGVVIVQIESQGEPMAAGVEMATGRNLWKIDRPDESNWSTPAVIRRNDNTVEVVLTSRDDTVGLDPITGQTKWTLDQPGSAIASATPAGNRLLIPASDLVALALDNDEAAPREQWRASQASPQNASAVVGNGRVYSLKGSVLLASDLETGDLIWKKRLGGLGKTWATPTLAGDRLYVFDQSGAGVLVHDQGDEAEVIGEVELPDGVYGSPAVVEGSLIVRGKRTLFCIR